MVFDGSVYVALITPFIKHDDKIIIDFESLRNLVKSIQSDVDGLVLLGSTGESCTLTNTEKLQIVKCVREFRDEKGFIFEIIVGIGGNNTQNVKENTQIFNDYADAYMVTVPNYNKPTQAGIIKHFQTISGATDKEIMLYNIPSRTGVEMTSESIVTTLKTCNNITAIKDATGNVSNSISVLSIVGNERVKIYSGDDNLILPFLSIGAKGVVSVIGHIKSKEIGNIIKLFNEGNVTDAQQQFFELSDLCQFAFIESNPSPIKYILHMRMIDGISVIKSHIVREPLVSCTAETKLTLMTYMIDRYSPHGYHIDEDECYGTITKIKN